MIRMVMREEEVVDGCWDESSLVELVGRRRPTVYQNALPGQMQQEAGAPPLGSEIGMTTTEDDQVGI